MVAEVMSSSCWPTLLGPLLQLAIIGIAIALLLQLITLEDALKKILGAALVVILLGCFIAVTRALWLGMPWWQHALVVLIGILCAAVAIRRVLT